MKKLINNIKNIYVNYRGLLIVYFWMIVGAIYTSTIITYIAPSHLKWVWIMWVIFGVEGGIFFICSKYFIKKQPEHHHIVHLYNGCSLCKAAQETNQYIVKEPLH